MQPINGRYELYRNSQIYFAVIVPKIISQFQLQLVALHIMYLLVFLIPFFLTVFFLDEFQKAFIQIYI